jgi:hypothetical protein
MSGTIGGFDVDSGERIFNPEPGNEASNEAFRSDLFETPEWVELRFKFDLESGMEIVNAVIDSVPNPKLLSRVQSIIRKVVLAGGLTRFGNVTPINVAEPELKVEPEQVPVDRNGRPLSASQIAWGEMARWSQQASSQDIRERRRTDPAFASFYRLNIERETRQTESTQFALAGLPTAQSTASEKLQHFAKLYRELPTDRLKPRGGYIVLSDEFRLTKSQFDNFVSEATNAGIL